MVFFRLLRQLTLILQPGSAEEWVIQTCYCICGRSARYLILQYSPNDFNFSKILGVHLINLSYHSPIWQTHTPPSLIQYPSSLSCNVLDLKVISVLLCCFAFLMNAYRRISVYCNKMHFISLWELFFFFFLFQ